MIGVDVSQLQDGSFMKDQKAYEENIDPAEIKPERWKTPEAAATERETFTLSGERCNGRAQTDAKKRSMRRVKVAVVASSSNSWHVDEIQSNTQGDEVRSLRVHAHRNEKLAVVVWSDAAWANRKDLSLTLGFFSGVTTTRILQGGRHGVTPIITVLEHRNAKEDRV